MQKKIAVLILIGLLVCAGAIFAGGAKEAPKAAAAAVEAGGEAPQLAAMVARGELPPVSERLPENPYVMEVFQEIGRYGGTLRRGYTGTGDTPGLQKMARVGFVEFGPDPAVIEPHMAERFTISDDGLVYTFYLRKGLRWSDGEPFTTADVEFAYRHIALNEELTSTPPARVRIGTQLVDLEILDDYTFRFVLPTISATFLQNLTTDDGWGANTPAHYLKQYHAEFAETAELARLVRAEGFEDWVQLFEAKNSEWDNPDRPTMRAWVAVDPLGASVLRMERNPYYWKVDPAGNQLPYIDTIENRLFLDLETLLLATLSGQIDFQGRHLPWGQFPILMENRDRGNYEVYRYPMSWGSDYAFMPNLNVADPKLNELFNDRRFRIALSHAMDRDEINEVLYLGQAKVRAATAVPESPYYVPEVEMLYAEFDPAKSEALLREIGLSKGSDGYWRHKDGSELSFVLNNHGANADVLELVSEQWDSFGLKNEVVILDRALYTTRYRAGEFDIGGWAWGRGFQPLIAPKFVFPQDDTWNPGPLFGTWYSSGGTAGVEPPIGHPVRTAQDMYRDEYLVEPDPVKRTEIGKALIRLSAEEIWSIGTVGAVPDPHIASRRLRNVPESVLSEHQIMTPSNANVEQFFYVD